MRISDWSSDVCSSDLDGVLPGEQLVGHAAGDDDRGDLDVGVGRIERRPLDELIRRELATGDDPWPQRVEELLLAHVDRRVQRRLLLLTGHVYRLVPGRVNERHPVGDGPRIAAGQPAPGGPVASGPD